MHASDEVANAVSAGERLVDNGLSPDAQATREQTDSLGRQLQRLDERARTRETDLETTLNRLQQFQQRHADVLEDIQQASEEVRRLKSVGSEVDVIKSQQEEFAAFRQQVVEPIARGVDEVNRLGSGLIQSAAGGVNTTSLEKDLEKVNDKWNTLKDKVIF